MLQGAQMRNVMKYVNPGLFTFVHILAVVSLAAAADRFPRPGEFGFDRAQSAITNEQAEANFELQICIQNYIFANVTSHSDAMRLATAGCSICPKQRQRYNEASARFYEWLSALKSKLSGRER